MILEVSLVCVVLWLVYPRTKAVIKSAVIIGGSSGIGREIALQYASRGIKTVIVGRRLLELEQVVQECALKAESHSFQGDITIEDDMRRLLRFADTKFKTDTLVLVAGVLSVQPFENLQDTSIIHQIFDVNTLGPIVATKIFLQRLMESKGRIVVVSSAASTMGAPTRSLYSATKHALNGFFNSLRIELDGRVDITIAMPGSVDTGLRKSALDALPDDKHKKAMDPSVCAKKIIEAVDYKQRYLFLPSYYRLATILSYIVPDVIDSIAKSKYKR
ncbi:hypothetical protein EDD86DRAFT_224147 [Gorgonomyces haynaldii]|nr:hypothetical protein EDD86DRAFT_224147 [Gorgonomyces haynaldii]